MASTRLSSSVVGGSDNTGAGEPEQRKENWERLLKDCKEPNKGTSGKASTSCTKIVRHSSIQHTTEPTPGTSRSEPTSGNKILNLLDLPVEILEIIFGHLSYKNVADLRLVCRQVDSVCGTILSSTFQRLQTQTLNRLKSIKAKMPRRKSARRTHPLHCKLEIFETLHMSLTSLQMTFGEHIERLHCCFFAGEILDEFYRILNYVKVTPVPFACHYNVTGELIDLSLMANEYFKEHIEPTLPEIAYFETESIGSSTTEPHMCLNSPSHGRNFDAGTSDGIVDSSPQSNKVLRKRIRKIKHGMKRYKSQHSLTRRDLRKFNFRMTVQQKQILEYANRLDETDKKTEENSQNFSTLLQELNKCKTEFWRSKFPANPLVCTREKVLAPGPSEDIQALINQGVVPEGLGMVSEESEGALLTGSCEILPAASTSGEQEANSEQTEGDSQEICSGNVWNQVGCHTENRTDCHVPASKNEKDIQPKSPQPCSSNKPCTSKHNGTDELNICHE